MQDEVDGWNGIPYGPAERAFKQWVQVTHASSTYVRERLLEAFEGTASA